MAFDDDEFDAIFPVLPRTNGQHTGGANQRQMLRGSSESFRTTQRFNADGSVTTLRTKNGHEQFDTTLVPQEDPIPDEEVYMETGQATWTFPGELNPTRNAPATWEMIDLDPQGRWMGGTKVAIGGAAVKVADLGEQIFPQPSPVDDPVGVLRDKIPSVAIGFPPSPDAMKQATLEASYGPQVVMKKLACGYFPPSLFSGKMRLFMQAQYGAPIKKKGFDYQVDIAGSSIILKYKDKTDDTWPEMQLGFWSHFTTGLFSAANYNYYILQLEEASGSSLMNVSVIPLVPSRAGAFIRARLIENVLTGVDKDKAEAYLLSTMRIDTTKKTTVGSYDPGLCGETVGSALAYGWKFNDDGSKASIVRVGQVGDAGLNTIDGRAKEIHLTIGRTSVFDGSETGKWTISGTASAERPWLDGWGRFNIFAPESETSSVLNLFSYRLGFSSVAAYLFSAVPVYGYYDSDGLWVTASVARASAGEPAYYKQYRSAGTNILGSALASETYYPDTDVFEYKRWLGNTKRYTNTSEYVQEDRITSYEGMSVSVGAWEFDGSNATGTTFRDECGPGGSGFSGVSPPGSDVPYVGYGSPTFTGDVGQIGFGATVGGLENQEPAFWSWLADQGPVSSTDVGSSHLNMSQVWNHYAGIIERAKRWTLVIPSGDCSAVHVATHIYDHQEGSVNMSPNHTLPSTMTTHVKALVGYPSPGWYPELRSFTGSPILCDMDDICFRPGGETITDYAKTENEAVTITAFSRTLFGVSGTPSGGYSSLFNVDSSNPTYNGSIAFAESYAGWYVGSEGYNSGGILNNFFMGWV